MPNLNSSTGSWVIKFAELDGGRKEGELLEPVATEKSDPGYPLELIRANVHGMVTLYAIIHVAMAKWAIFAFSTARTNVWIPMRSKPWPAGNFCPRKERGNRWRSKR